VSANIVGVLQLSPEPMMLYHATNYAAAESIYRERRFRCSSSNKSLFAGAAVYFCEEKAETSRRYRGGKHGLPDVVIKCEVNVGTVIEAQRYRLKQKSCFARGGDSVKIIGVDVFATYDPDRITIVNFEDIRTGREWQPVAGAPKATSLSLHLESPVHSLREGQAAARREARPPVQVAPLSVAEDLHSQTFVAQRRQGPQQVQQREGQGATSQELRSPVQVAPLPVVEDMHSRTFVAQRRQVPPQVQHREAQACCFLM